MRLLNLILHFDINKTIILSDSVSDRSLYSSLHSLVSEVCWGEFSRTIPKEARTAYDWVPILDHPTCIPPTEDAVSFGTYLEDHTLISKPDRRKLKTTFAEVGNIGHRYLPYVHELHEKLSISTEDDEASSLPVQNRYHFILPSFYRLLDYLFSEEVLSCVNWRIVFRSFGADSPEVIAEINDYLEGNHPHFKPQNIEFSSRCKIHNPNDTGAYLRTGASSHDVHLALVSQKHVLTTVSGSSDTQQYLEDSLLTLSKSATEGRVQTDENFCKKRFIVLKDDYKWWAQNNESDDSGKLLLVDNRSITRASQDSLLYDPSDLEHIVYQAFYDDNIERDRPHIVDVRDASTFEPIPFTLTKDNILIRAEPYLAVGNEDYFMESVQRLIKKWQLD